MEGMRAMKAPENNKKLEITQRNDKASE